LPRPPTIAALARLADELEADAEGATPAEAVKLLRRALVLRRALEELQGDPNSRTLLDGMAQAQPEIRRPGRPTKSRHPFPVALEARRKTVAEWARDNGLPREVVKAWIATGSAGRRIPLSWAKAIQKELGVPATDDVWRNGIRA
jgi:hypothetical protein